MTKPKKPNPAIGDLIALRFYDHSEGSQHIVFDVVGWVMQKDRRSIVLASWKYADSNEVDDNVTQWTILRVAIKSITVLQKAEPSGKMPVSTTPPPQPTP
jgi:hypothetical protein